MKSEAIKTMIEAATKCKGDGLIAPARYSTWDKFISEFEEKLVYAKRHEEALSEGFSSYHEMAQAYEMGFI